MSRPTPDPDRLLDVTGTVNESNFDHSGWIGMWVVGESELTITGSESSFNQERFLFDDQSDVDAIGNVATNNSGAGFWWDLEANGIASLPAATPGTNVADPTPTTISDGPAACPSGFSLSASRCVRVIGASQRTCAEGVLSGAQCASDTPADGEQASHSKP